MPSTVSGLPPDRDDVRRRTGELAGLAYGRLLALLAAKRGDIMAAEDALADAFSAALRTWPDAGIPTNPEAWLLTVARNAQHDTYRSAAVQRTEPYRHSVHDVRTLIEHEYTADDVPDRQLALLFVCAHPAIDPAVHTPLMLQTVLGYDAERIAAAFVMPPATMAQRLVRAKRRIRETRIPFVIPERSMMATRLSPVLEAIYGAYAIEFSVVAGTTPRESLVSEARYLATLLQELLPNEPEVHGLAALLSLSLARLPARGDGSVFVPLHEQDCTLWDAELIAAGERALHRAHAFGRPGRFQIEAAIQSVHCARAESGQTDWIALRMLYGALVTFSPTLGARVAHAAAIGQADGAAAGLAALDAITDEVVHRFQPAWAARAHFLAQLGDLAAAQASYRRAISLTTDLAARRYLEGQSRRAAMSRETTAAVIERDA